jgi:Protein tyrosine and serine/threonine kinase
MTACALTFRFFQVWMFGCTIIEACTCNGTPNLVLARFLISIFADLLPPEPYPDMSNMQAATLVATSQLSPEMPQQMPMAMRPAIQQCFGFQPHDRPTFFQISQSLSPA